MVRKTGKKTLIKKTTKKTSSGLLKFLEAIVVVGAVAGVLMKLFRGGNNKKRK